MLSITDHQGSATQSCTEIPFAPSRKATLKDQIQTKDNRGWQGCGEPGTLPSWSCSWERKTVRLLQILRNQKAQVVQYLLQRYAVTLLPPLLVPGPAARGRQRLRSRF